MTATTGTWTSTPVVGDGTTTSSRAGRRWRRLRWLLLGLLCLAVVAAALAVTRPLGSSTPYAPDNNRPGGAQAVARVLEDQGVEVTYTRSVADAVTRSGPGTTLLVAPGAFLTTESAEQLAGTAGDLVLASAGRDLLAAASDGQIELVLGDVPTTPVPPGCELGAAQAAGTSMLIAGLRASGPDTVACWTDAGGAAALAAVTVDGRTVTAVDDPTFLRNGTITEHGNAALALHLLGANEQLVWLVPEASQTTGADDDLETANVLPAWFGPLTWWAGLVLVVAVVWRVRRLGGLVAEDLPVVVPSAESTRGRGRLYRRTRARGHAAAGLRAAASERMARRIGIPRSAPPETVVGALVRATGRDPREISDLLYGPPPADDGALAELARRLDTLESEVHRP